MPWRIGSRRIAGGSVDHANRYRCRDREAGQAATALSTWSEKSCGRRSISLGREVKTCPWDFISLHRNEFGVQRLCRVLGVYRSAYYKWLADAEARAVRPAADSEPSPPSASSTRSREEPTGCRGCRGCMPGCRANRKRVAGLIRRHQIAGVCLRRRRRTTIVDKTAAPAPDLLGREPRRGGP